MPRKQNKTKVYIKGLAGEDIKETLESALAAGDYSVEVESGEIILWINQRKESLAHQKTDKNATIADIEALARKYDVPLTKRIYRKKEQRPDPLKSPATEFNRTGKKLNIRVDPELIEALKESAKKANIPQTEWITEAIKAKLDLDCK
jgi:predicted DNA binding CopG/RHH family protein